MLVPCLNVYLFTQHFYQPPADRPSVLDKMSVDEFFLLTSSLIVEFFRCRVFQLANFFSLASFSYCRVFLLSRFSVVEFFNWRVFRSRVFSVVEFSVGEFFSWRVFRCRVCSVVEFSIDEVFPMKSFCRVVPVDDFTVPLPPINSSQTIPHITNYTYIFLRL